MEKWKWALYSLVVIFYVILYVVHFGTPRFTFPDLHNYFKEMRYHVETTCDVINVTDLGPRKCDHSKNYTCWQVRVIGHFENWTHANLFSSFAIAQDSGFECANKNCEGNSNFLLPKNTKISGLILSANGTVKCFYNPGKPERAYLQTGVGWLTLAFVATLFIFFVNLVVCACVYCCCEGEEAKVTLKVMTLMYLPYITLLVFWAVVLYCVVTIPIYLVKRILLCCGKNKQNENVEIHTIDQGVSQAKQGQIQRVGTRVKYPGSRPRGWIQGKDPGEGIQVFYRIPRVDPPKGSSERDGGGGAPRVTSEVEGRPGHAMALDASRAQPQPRLWIQLGQGGASKNP